MESKIKLGVSGDAGSFSEEAGRLYIDREGLNAKIVYAVDMEGVLARLNRGEIDQGIFPVVNSQGGLVRQAFDAMGRYNFAVMSELWLEVQQCLWVLPGLKREEIRYVATHPQAILQCQRYLKREFLEVKIVEWADTAKAAHDLKAGLLPTTSAVIAPSRAAQLYGLEVLERNIQDMRPNLTTFIIVSNMPRFNPSAYQFDAADSTFFLWRSMIEELDHEIINVISHRLKVGRRVQEYKKLHQLPLHDPEREQKLEKSYEQWIRDAGIEQMDAVKNILHAIISEVKK